MDISLGILEYETVVKKATKLNLDKKEAIRKCSFEELIIHKMVAEKTQNLRDIEGILICQSKKLDIKYIRKWLKNFLIFLQ